MNGLAGMGLLIIVLTVLFGWLIGGICILAGFIVGIALLAIGLVTPQDNNITSERTQDRYCPTCGRSIPFDAIICPYCGKKFEPNHMGDLKSKNESSNVVEKCPSCGCENKSGSKFCKKCGTEFGGE